MNFMRIENGKEDMMINFDLVSGIYKVGTDTIRIEIIDSKPIIMSGTDRDERFEMIAGTIDEVQEGELNE